GHVPSRHVVRVHGRRLVACDGYAISLERRYAALDEEPDRRLAGRVRAAVEKRMRFVGDDSPVRVDARPQTDPRSVARVRRRELVGVARDRANGTSRRLREVIEDELVGREALAAEVTADGPVVDDDAILRETERRGHLVAQVERSLVRGDDAHPIGFEPHHRGPRLERCLMNARRGELVLEDARGPSGWPRPPAPVRTACTPASARARPVSTDTMRACGYGLRTKAASMTRGTTRSAVYLAAPVVLSSPSIRRSGRSRSPGWINAPRPSRGGIRRIPRAPCRPDER